MTITRVGTTKKYAEGWESAFSGNRKKRKTVTTAAKSPSGATAAAKNRFAKKANSPKRKRR